MSDGFAAFMFMASIIISLGGVIFFWLFTRHRERTQLIEKGADASLFQSDPRKKSYFFVMLLGILFICLALGIGLGFFIEDALQSSGVLGRNHSSPGPYFFGIFLMLGVGFVAAFFVNRKYINKE
ncbi:DUF6249 domain-containing protein [Roseivirga misakiensis]|uniref:DUF6249 domain-containing protein n=1 Tax=Roseivirga misakiensis TaxID=1563681 RepID=A0A1E5T5J8_9BACT|nr:DUF6249 domain-containing protein [Roseivirga misakiensis]OEK06649.1 hypothetical protein BFP71_02995 [Roseivirga misakiensis]